MSAAFQLDGVTCRFGNLAAVDDVSLKVEAGEQVAFIGPSGSGKTTLLRVMNTMLSPGAGELSVLGREVASLDTRNMRRLRSDLATIPQHLGLVPNLTALQNVVLGRGGKRGTMRSIRDLLLPTRSDTMEIHGVLERVGIEEKLYSRVSELSGGQRQRVAIARALFQNPAALLADEPVSSVDPARARDTVKLLVGLSSELGFSLCVSLHHVDLAKEFFPRLVGLRSGKIVFDASPDEVEDSQFSELYELSDQEMMRDA